MPRAVSTISERHFSAAPSLRPLTQSSSSTDSIRVPRRRVPVAVLCLVMVAVPWCARAQDSQAAPAKSQASPATPAKSVPTVHTTVVVRGKVDELYQQPNATLGGFEQLPLLEMPQSGMVVTRSVLNDQQARLLSDVTKNDASIGENYAPVGYYQDFQIRGFPIDLATGVKINGITVSGEQLVPLENKESVEFVKGASATEAGVASPGGLINFTTKRPATVRTLNLATDERGSAFGHMDLGSVFGPRQQFGLRTNFGGESMHSYVNGANGWRSFGTLAADWKISDKTTLRGDFEYQHMVQGSASGYQLLGGTIAPANVDPAVMLGWQKWARPNIFDALNASLRLDRKLTSQWSAYVTAGRSRSLIDDNVAWAYGCYYVSSCNSGGAPYPWFFSPAGDYDVYDYRSPGELRNNDQLEAILYGRHKTGPITHHLVVGTTLLRRSVKLADSLFDYVGSENIHQLLQMFAPSPNSPGTPTLRESSHQCGVVLQDRLELPHRISLSVGGQIDTLHDHNYSQVDPATYETYLKITNKTLWLPRYAASWRPIERLSIYGNYSVALSMGPQAPFWATNGSVFLDPFFTRQVEVGAKYQVGGKLLVSLAFFRMRAPFFYPKPVADGLEFVQQGHENHRGIEFTAQGAATRWLRLTASAAAIAATSENTGTPAFDNHQVLNQPRLRTTLFGDVLVPHVPGLGVLVGWSYTGRKSATRDDTVSVDGYNLFSAGLRYTPRREQSRFTFRVIADNLTNKRYWKDTGASYGDTFLHPGAPLTVRSSTQFSF